MSLYQLQELATRQQEQIESTQRLLANKEQRLNYLSSMQDSQQRPMFDYDQHLNLFKDKINMQEAKLRKLRLLKGQIQKQRYSNSNVCSELETLKLLFKEKERELSVALNKIETLTRQLDEIKNGNINAGNSFPLANSYNKHSFELENLRQELLFKTKIFKQNEEELVFKRNLLYKRKCDMLKVDQRINDLQSRLARKKQLNQQLASQTTTTTTAAANNNIPFDGINENGTHLQTDHHHHHHHHSSLFAPKSLLRSSIGHHPNNKTLPSSNNIINNNNRSNAMNNVATVEPLPRFKFEYDYSTRFDYGTNKKQDPKYQTLPYNTKFGLKFKNIGELISPKETNNRMVVDDDSLNELSSKYTSNIDCDSSVNNANINNANKQATNEISLIINTNKNDSLEERPSPSGSSGSSDRISSSLTTYSYNEKLNFSELKYNNNNSNDLQNKTHHHHSISDDNLLPHRFVPNSTLTSSTILPDNEIVTNELNVEPNSIQKGKPSVPVKPIATNDNNNEDHNGNSLFTSNQNEMLNTFESIRNNDDVDNLSVNMEPRTSVSEIVNKLNSLSCKESWEKTKRRPVFASNEMEKELQKSSADETIMPNVCHEKENLNENEENATNSLNMRTLVGDFQTEQQDLINNNEKVNVQNETIIKEKEDESKTTTTTTTTNDESPNIKETKLPTKMQFKRLKGSLKNKDSQVNGKTGLARRVSFDPLALLLDASLEGELELVKKTANQVPNPSSSNDEGITALHNATCAGHFEIVKYLVEIGCDVNAQDSDGWTPLHCAASCNNLTMIKFLVKSGACIFATTFSDHETSAEKCEEDEEGFDGCSQYLYGIQEKMGVSNNGIVYALYDYECQNDDELSFKEGDVIKVLQKGDDQEKEWWWSKIGNQEGYIPRNLIGLHARIKSKEQSTK